MRVFKSWKWYELVYLVFSLAVVLVCFFVVREKNWLSLVSSLLGVVTTILYAKALVYAPIFCALELVFYIAISATQRYWGEVAISVLITLPLIISTIVGWIKNRSNNSKDIVKISSIKKNEYAILLLVTIALTVVFYFVLQALNTNQLIVSTLSVSSSTIASYFLLRRSKLYAVGYMLNDIILIILWSMSVVNSGMQYLPSVICYCFFFINDFYGLINWGRELKKQIEPASNN